MGHAGAPSPWIVRFAHLVPPGSRVLDLASGNGRHARFFAQRDCHVVAVDRDAALLAALDDVPNVTTELVDLEAGDWPFGNRRFGAIVVTNYLHRPRLPQLAAALTPDGVLLYETFAAGNERYGRPSNPDFLLHPNELLEAFGSRLAIVAFEQGEVHGEAGTSVLQRIVAVGHARPWPAVLAPAAASR